VKFRRVNPHHNDLVSLLVVALDRFCQDSQHLLFAQHDALPAAFDQAALLPGAERTAR
jgi:hypothetical protein